MGLLPFHVGRKDLHRCAGPVPPFLQGTLEVLVMLLRVEVGCSGIPQIQFGAVEHPECLVPLYHGDFFQSTVLRLRTSEEPITQLFI